MIYDQKLLAECQRFFAEQEKHRPISYPLQLQAVVLNDGSQGQLQREHFDPQELKRYQTLAQAGGGDLITAVGTLTGRVTHGLGWIRVELSHAGELIGLAGLVWAASGWPDYFQRFRYECQRSFRLTNRLPPTAPPAVPWVAAMLAPHLNIPPAPLLILLWKLAIGAMDLVVQRRGQKAGETNSL